MLLRCGFITGNSPTSLSPLTVFTLFPKFPPELRIMVWKMTIPRLSIMVLELDVYHEDVRFQKYSGTGNSLTAILRTCRESRRIVKAERPCQHMTGRSDLEIRFHTDTVIYIPNFSVLIYEMNMRRKWNYGTAFQGIKYLAIPFASYCDWYSLKARLQLCDLPKFGADVRHIILVRYNEYHSDDTEKRYMNLLIVRESLDPSTVNQAKDAEKTNRFSFIANTLPTMDG
ncbi:hypothetical protein N431DRAFT_462450 [Stipitochalara longipes BDJ]|nr:hypothetical protein N431DRAFT_462450 [Stipitochalara longipes BDJ]